MTRVHSPEDQAVLALCSHEVYQPDCELCTFRQQAAVARLQRVIKDTMDSLNEPRRTPTGKDITIHLATGKELRLYNWSPKDADNLRECLNASLDGTTCITRADGTAVIVNRSQITHVEIVHAEGPVQ